MKQHQICLHHTTVSRKSNSIQLWAVNRYHKGKWNIKSTLGWFVGYNYFIDGDGTLTQCRSLEEETMANRGNNCDTPKKCTTISVCLSGNFDLEWPSAAQNATLKRFLLDHRDLKVTFHKYIQAGRTCPGKNLDQKYIVNLLRIVPEEDAEKAAEIKRLKSTIDILRKIIASLLKAINLKT